MGEQVELQPVEYMPGDTGPEGVGSAGSNGNAAGDLDYFSALRYQQEILQNVSGTQVKIEFNGGEPLGAG
jgi:hypothetical protein